MTAKSLDFAGARVLVFGDCMLDCYLHGAVGRISPEAPVPVVSLANESYHLGGSGNVAATVAALGGAVTLAAIVGLDEEGARIRTMLEAAGIDDAGVVEHPAARTVSKTRIIAGRYQQLLRVDRDGDKAARETAAQAAANRLLPLVDEQDAIVLADYDKGTLPPVLVHEVIARCRA